MKTLLVLDGLGVGGTERQMELLLRHWPESAGPISVLAFGGTPALAERWSEFADLSLIERRGRGGRELSAILRRSAEESGVTVILAAHRYAGLLAKWARLGGMRIPVVCSIRGRQPWSLRRRLVYEWIDPALMFLARRVLSNSSQPPAEIRRIPWASSRTTFVPNGLEPAAPPLDAPSRVEGEIVSVGRLEPVKAPHRMLYLVAGLRARGIGATGVWIGGGSLQSELAAETRRRGMDELVRWVGEQDDPSPWLWRASLYFHPSVWENTSNAILEAMQAHLPVVARRVGGNPDIVEEGRTGVLFDSEAEALDQCEELIRDLPRAREMGAAGEFRVREHFSVERMVRAHVEVLQEASARS